MEYAGITHCGFVRDDNQDSYALCEEKGNILAVVCDGIGGGNAGDVASKLASTYLQGKFIQANFENKSDYEIKCWIKQAMKEVNDYIFTKSIADPKFYGMGTTVVGCLILKQGTYMFNAGDSRCYAIYDNDLICLSEDHTYLADLIKSGKLTLEEAQNHPQKHVLTNAVGVWDEFRLDINKIKDHYDYLLICSDGLHGYVSEELIKTILQDDINVDAKVKLLLAQSLNVGGYDNITIIILKEDNKHD